MKLVINYKDVKLNKLYYLKNIDKSGGTLVNEKLNQYLFAHKLKDGTYNLFIDDGKEEKYICRNAKRLSTINRYARCYGIRFIEG